MPPSPSATAAPPRARRAPVGAWGGATGTQADPRMTGAAPAPAADPTPPAAPQADPDPAPAAPAPAAAAPATPSAPRPTPPGPRALPPAAGAAPRPAPRAAAPAPRTAAPAPAPAAAPVSAPGGRLLPSTKTPPRSSLSDFTILLYGPPKIGKTTLASQFEDCIFLATEPGLNALEAYQVAIDSWQTFIDVCKELAAGGHPFKTIVVDTVDNLFKFCSEAVLRKAGVQHESDLEWGKGWTLVKDEFLRIINRLALLPYGLILISHAEFTNIKTPTKQIVKAVPTMPRQAREITLGIADFILYAEALDTEQGTTRILRCQAGEAWEAGTRISGFPAWIEMSYEAFRAAFDAAIASQGGAA